MSNKRRIYTSRKHYLHLSRKKNARMEAIYNLLACESPTHGNTPVDMQFQDSHEQLPERQNNF